MALRGNFYKGSWGQMVVEGRGYAWTVQRSPARLCSLSASRPLCTAQTCCSVKVIVGTLSNRDVSNLWPLSAGQICQSEEHTVNSYSFKFPGWLEQCCRAPLRLLLWSWRGAAPPRGAHRGREDLHGGMLRQPELWLALLQEVD